MYSPSKCPSFVPSCCVDGTCPIAQFDYLYNHPDYGPQYLREMGEHEMTCAECGATDVPDCDECIFQGNEEYCPKLDNETIQGGKK